MLELYVALATVLGALVAGATTIYAMRRQLRMQERLHADERLDQAERLLRKYRDPLVRAAFDLQSRLYNIAMHDFLGKYLVRGTEAEKEYAKQSTLYVIGEYFGWVEIMRREVQFLDLRDATRNRELAERLEKISACFLAERPDSTLRIFRGEQRAIGEVMIAGGEPGSRECIGYAGFISRRADPTIGRWFEKLSADLTMIATEPATHLERLVAVQGALVELLGFLDADQRYFPETKRRRLDAAPGPPGSG